MSHNITTTRVEFFDYVRGVEIQVWENVQTFNLMEGSEVTLTVTNRAPKIWEVQPRQVRGRVHSIETSFHTEYPIVDNIKLIRHAQTLTVYLDVKH